LIYGGAWDSPQKRSDKRVVAVFSIWPGKFFAWLFFLWFVSVFDKRQAMR